ncbi:hypothetical protein M406DRAFT_326807 [Cryphonectria parasitica EP155]|uniref:Uncharacterized protein n=1 Tax=Cryphonectria parasitica (strain ATCC 38755 / EP155) TaxID=660469 RepID=A0A9P4Y827_CRYP1|nr:uncharacterized protein M406DRAFT_326807 [Cryphonectria parasitica EP155]KAF3768206.1 hypothetical protein M406DRAFT_326807 [Cryphonectria parasitica EP155]
MRLPAPKDDQQASPDSHWSKRRRLDDQEQHFNLAEILVTCTRDGKTHSVPLVSFIPSNLLNIEKPQVYQFSYDLLRTWLETCCGMPPETPLAVLLHASDGSPNTSIVENKWNFAKVLHRIWNGTCVVPYDAELKFYLPVADACDTPNAAKDDLPQDPVPAAQKEDDQAATDQPRAPVLDLTKDDSDDDQVEDAADEAHLLIGFDPKKWNMTRRMFQLDQVPERREAKYRLRGIARPPHMYQLITVWNILTNPITTGVSGLMIGWDVGFGKTMLTLVFLRIRAELAMQWVEVKREWEAAKKGGLVERRHWPEGAQEPQSRCPSYVPTYHKGVLEGSIQCPCVPGSQSREICEWYLTNTPALIVLPAGLIPNWLEEAAKVYADMDPNDADSDPLMTFLVYSSDLKSKNGEIVLPRPKNTRGWKEISDTKGGQVVSSDEYGTEELLFISGGSGIARDIFIASSAAVDRMLKCFNEADTYYSQWKKIKTRILTVGAFVMDEFHLYKGTNDATLAFNHLKTIAGCANHPVSLITLCGTTLEEGPSAFQHVIQHFVNQHKKFRNGDNDLRCIDKHGYRVTNEQFEKMKQLFRSAVQGLGFQGRSVEEIKKELAPCVSFCRQFMDCLRRGQKYRGKPIDPLPPLLLIPLLRLSPQAWL